MYNIYIHEKQLSDFEKASNEKRKIIKFESKRKRKINSLTKKYNNRMKNFVLNLCESPVILGQNEEINDFSKTQDLFNNSQNEPKNYLVFGNYISDKKKIELINQEKMILKKYEEINKQSQRKRDLLNAQKNNNNIILLQPRMKFGPREEIENIVESINKNGSFNINKKYTKILNDHLKKLKDNNVRYIKGYDLLKNNYDKNNSFKNALLKKDFQENEYSYKKVIASKLSNNANNDYQDKKNKILENIGPENNDENKNDSTKIKKINSQSNYNIIKSNELKKLFNDNRKIYFKGASQFINLKLVKSNKKHNHNSTDDIQENEISVIYTDKNIYIKKGNNFMNKKNDKNNEKKIEKPKSIPEIKKIEKKPKINMTIFTPTSQNEKAHERYLNKYIELDIPQKNRMSNSPLLEDNIEDNPKGLCEESKIKKIKMNSLMNKEINKSIVNNYMDKYDIINQFNKNNTINTNSLYFQGYNSHFAEKPDENLSEKLKYLIKVIQKRNREIIQENNNVASYMNSTSHFKLLNKKEKKKPKKVASNDYILIDGQFISKKDIKALSDAIFIKCHFYKKKKAQSQRNILNNNEKLGKMAGLTASNFYSKSGA